MGNSLTDGVCAKRESGGSGTHPGPPVTSVSQRVGGSGTHPGPPTTSAPWRVGDSGTHPGPPATSVVISCLLPKSRTWTGSLYGHQITVEVSRGAYAIDSWVDGIYRFHDRRIREGRLVAGLGVQWRPGSGPPGRENTAVVQICVGRRCLIVQLGFCREVPEALRRFLEDARVSFAGVGIKDDGRRLGFRGLRVANHWEVRKMAVAKYGRQWSNASMGDLADLVLGIKGVTKRRRVGCSNWDALDLSSDQVAYACEDAYLAFLLGLNLL